MLGIIGFVVAAIDALWRARGYGRVNTEGLEAKPFLFFFYRLVPKEKNQGGRKVIRMKRFNEIK